MQSSRSPLHSLAALAAFVLVVAAIWLPRSLALGRFVTPDEHLWLTRSANFYTALASGDFAATYQMGHPGVTVMWAGTAGFIARYPEYTRGQPGQLDPSQFHQYIQRKSEEVSPLELLTAGRFFMVLGHTLALGAAYLYARRLFGTPPALLGMLLLALDPFHIGLNRVLHLDGLYANLALLSALACLGYLQTRHRRHLAVSAAAAGLAWLTKSPGLFTIPVVGVFLLADVLHSTPRRDLLTPAPWGRAVLTGLLWFGLAAVVFVAAWPAMWVAPIETLAKVFGMARQFSEAGHESALFFNGVVVQDGNFGASMFYFYPLTYLWRVTPLALFGLVIAAAVAALRRPPFDRPQVRAAALALLVMALVFAAGLTVPAKKFDRYLMPVYPPLDLLAGLGWWGAAAWLGSRGRITRFAAPAVAAAVILLQAASALGVFPYYLSYYNPLLGGSGKAPQVMQVGWGEGLDQAARYLNEKPGAGKLQVMTLHSTGCFSYYFRGRDRSFSYESGSSAEEWETFNRSDYALVYISQRQRGLSAPILEYLDAMTPEKTIVIDGIEYVRIYRLR